jgi:hypothetical protein
MNLPSAKSQVEKKNPIVGCKSSGQHKKKISRGCTVKAKRENTARRGGVANSVECCSEVMEGLKRSTGVSNTEVTFTQQLTEVLIGHETRLNINDYKGEKKMEAANTENSSKKHG